MHLNVSSTGTRNMTSNNGLNRQTAGWQSHNWSGYAIQSRRKKFNSISGDWIVPSVKATSQNTYSAAWIGMDGFNNQSLIQVGTIQAYVNGKATYSAFWETIPNQSSAQMISKPVAPLDLIHGEITNICDDLWKIKLTNKTQGWQFSTKVAYQGPRQSAEWIIEAPFVNGSLSTLAQYGQTKFFNLTANDMNPDLEPCNRGVMIQNGKQVSTPSRPNKKENAFNIAYGSKMPPSPPANC